MNKVQKPTAPTKKNDSAVPLRCKNPLRVESGATRRS